MEYPENQRFICLTCGFLAKHVLPNSPYQHRYFEIATYDREKGLCFIEPTNIGTAATLPVCIEGRADLVVEIQAEQEDALEHHTTESRETAAYSRFCFPRNCKYWFPYSPGFSPKEHVEMYHTDRLFELSLQIQNASLAAAKRNLWATVMFGIIVVLLSAMQVLEVWYFSRHPTTPTVIIQQQPVDQPKNSN